MSLAHQLRENAEIRCHGLGLALGTFRAGLHRMGEACQLWGRWIEQPSHTGAFRAEIQGISHARERSSMRSRRCVARERTGTVRTSHRVRQEFRVAFAVAVAPDAL